MYVKAMDDLLCSIVMKDTSWVHYFEPAYQSEVMEYSDKGFPAPEKFRAAYCAGKVVISGVLDVNGVLHSELMSAPTTINNCECNVGMLQQLKIHV
jgi:hypothetical protein